MLIYLVRYRRGQNPSFKPCIAERWGCGQVAGPPNFLCPLDAGRWHLADSRILVPPGQAMLVEAPAS